MDGAVQFYYAQGLAASTVKTYKSAQGRYLAFCTKYGVSAVPVMENILCSFVSVLANQGLKHQTVKCYLSAVRHLQVSQGFAEPFQGVSMPRLEYVLRSIKKHQARNSKGGATRLPITPGILQTLKTTWETSPLENPKDAIMIWAACCLAFFGFLRLAECTVPNDRDFDPQDHLTLQDLSFDHASSPQVMFVTIKRSNHSDRASH